MLVLEMVDKLKRLGDKVSLSSSDKSDIELMFHEVLGRTFTKTSCGDCYRDAVIEMYSYLKRYGIVKCTPTTILLTKRQKGILRKILKG